jgi:peroxiredoxin
MFSNKPRIGAKAPDFSLPSHLGSRVTLSQFGGQKNVLLAFYPHDWTPVCTTQVSDYEENLAEFEKYNTQPLAISVDPIPCHQAWTRSLGGITIPVLSDFWPHGDVCNKYNVMHENGHAERVIFIIDTNSIIRYIENIGLINTPENENVFSFLKTLA